LEFVTKFRGVSFINDAKADNHNALYYTLGTIKQKIIWITGNNEGFVDYKDLLDIVSQKVKVIICVRKKCHTNYQVFCQSCSNNL
jgi:UDP-N-acetylmuramoylalanine--D-glutamate ligase